MAESSIRISLELADAAAQKSLTDFITKAGQADKATKQLHDTSESTFSEIGVHIGKATGIYEIFAGNLAANLVIEAFDFMRESAHKLFETFIVEGVKAAEETQNAINSLNVALAQSGHYSKEASDDFLEFSEGLQKTTTFSHDAIVQNAALIESLGRLDSEGLKRATKAALDLATATGKDLPAASELVAKAANGNITALNKMGLSLQTGRTHAETFGNALAAIEEHFGGAAESKVNTYSGAVAQASNSFKDLTEQIGNVVVKNPVFIELIHEVNNILNELTGTLEEQTGAFAQLVGAGFSVFLENAAFVVSMAGVVTRAFVTLGSAVALLLTPLDLLIVPLRAISVGFKQANAEADAFLVGAAKNLVTFGKGSDDALSTIAVDLLRMKEAADRGMDSLAKGADGTVAPLKNARGAVKELTEEQKSAQARLKSFAEDLLKQGESAKDGSSKALDIAKSQAEQQLAIEQSLLDRKLINEIQFETSKAAIQEGFAAKQQAIEFKQLADDQARARQALAQKLISPNEFDRVQRQLAVNFTAFQIKQTADETKREIKSEADILAAKKKAAQGQIATINDLSTLQNSKHRELFEIGKAANMAKIAIDTYSGAIGAYNAMASIPYVGPALGIAAAAAITAYGLEQESSAASVSFNYEQGGIVPGASFSGDRIVANVNSGEMILNREQQTSLFNMANGSGTTAIDYNKLAHAVAMAMSQQPVHVQVGGKTIVDTIRGELQSGRRFV